MTRSPLIRHIGCPSEPTKTGCGRNSQIIIFQNFETSVSQLGPQSKTACKISAKSVRYRGRDLLILLESYSVWFLRVYMILEDAVSKLETWILNHISTWSMFAVKASYLVKWSISTWSFMYWCQFIHWLKFETRPVPCWISERPIRFVMRYSLFLFYFCFSRNILLKIEAWNIKDFSVS